MAAAADRHLLFGLLARQTGIINQGQLVAAFQAWTLDKMRNLADILLARGDLNAVQRGLLEGLADQHLQKHGDVEKSLAVVPANRSARASLAALGEPEIEATLARVARSENGPAKDALDDDPDRTAGLSLGAATSDGQRFRILRPHARGGLGEVFVALDVELHREVALKQIVEKHADDPASRQRFVAEAEITGGLEHPGIVPVYGLGSYAGGRPYYAMRFIKGESLKQAIEHFHADDTHKSNPGRRSLELRKLLRRFLDVCNAIDYAHSRGVIHRDLKPANIILGRHGETLVVDWGLAKAIGRADRSVGEQTIAPSSSGSSETLPGSALGTPAYMSPEQAAGDLDRLGPHSDVYSLGATLYCLLTGKPPFEGEDVGEIIRNVQTGEFLAPREVDPSLDKALEAVCKKAMATKPADRYATCRALAEDVERWAADEPATAYREPLSRRARRWAKRNQTPVASAAVALLAGVVGLSAVLVVQTQAKADIARALWHDDAGAHRAGRSEYQSAGSLRIGLEGDQDVPHRRQRGHVAQERTVQGVADEALARGRRLLRRFREAACRADRRQVAHGPGGGVFPARRADGQDRVEAGSAGGPSQGAGVAAGAGGGGAGGCRDPAGRGPQPGEGGSPAEYNGRSRGGACGGRGATRSGRAAGGGTPDRRGPVRPGPEPRQHRGSALFYGEAGGRPDGLAQGVGHPAGTG